MPIIWLFVIAFVVGVIMMVVEFVQAVAEGIDARVADIGGWYVAAAFGAGLILLLIVMVRSGKRSERRDLLRAIPHQIDGRIARGGGRVPPGSRSPGTGDRGTRRQPGATVLGRDRGSERSAQRVRPDPDGNRPDDRRVQRRGARTQAEDPRA